MPECVLNSEGDILHRAPVGGYLQIRFVHVDGTVTPAYPQAVQDNRHAAIPYDKITARDITDTQRRGWCLAAAAVFGIGVELWTRDPLEQGYSNAQFDAEALETVHTAPESVQRAVARQEIKAAPKPAPAAKTIAPATTGGTSEPTEATFREAALAKGFTTYATDELVKLINGDYAKGVTTVANKTGAEVEALNAKFAPADGGGDSEQW
jgi:hypothetical protein